MSHIAIMNERQYPSLGYERPPSPTSSFPPPYDDEELPPGWAKVLDPESDQYFYVDSLARPPVPIWVHPFRHPQFLNTVGITPDEIPDNINPMLHTPVPSRSPTRDFTTEDDEHRSLLSGIRRKIRADKEARAAAHARTIRKRFRTRQLIYTEVRTAIINSRISRGDWHYGDIELTPPNKYEYGGPEYREGNAGASFVRKAIGAFIRGGWPSSRLS